MNLNDPFSFALRRLHYDFAALAVEWALFRFKRRLKAYNSDQPRAPAGNPDGGQWVGEGSDGGRVLIAGDLPRGDEPKIPEERPQTARERNRAVKLATRMPARLGAILKVAT